MLPENGPKDQRRQANKHYPIEGWNLGSCLNKAPSEEAANGKESKGQSHIHKKPGENLPYC
jgi:hypothetical protein